MGRLRSKKIKDLPGPVNGKESVEVPRATTRPKQKWHHKALERIRPVKVVDVKTRERDKSRWCRHLNQASRVPAFYDDEYNFDRFRSRKKKTVKHFEIHRVDELPHSSFMNFQSVSDARASVNVDADKVIEVPGLVVSTMERVENMEKTEKIFVAETAKKEEKSVLKTQKKEKTSAAKTERKEKRGVAQGESTLIPIPPKVGSEKMREATVTAKNSHSTERWREFFKQNTRRIAIPHCISLHRGNRSDLADDFCNFTRAKCIDLHRRSSYAFD